MPVPVKTIELVPTWKAAARIYMMALVNGTHEGRKAAEAGILEMAEKLDAINEERRAANRKLTFSENDAMPIGVYIGGEHVGNIHATPPPPEGESQYFYQCKPTDDQRWPKAGTLMASIEMVKASLRAGHEQ